MSQYLGSLYAIASGLSYGLTGFFGVNLLLFGHSVYNMLALRFAISFLFLIAVRMASSHNPPSWDHQTLLATLSGFILYSGCAIAYFFASLSIGSGLAMVIFFCYPVLVVLAQSLWTHTPCSRATALALLLIVFGIACLADISTQHFNPIGIAIALLSSVFYAAYVLSTASLTLSPIDNTLCVSLGAALSCSLLSVLFDTCLWPNFTQEWLYFVGIGILSTALPILLFLQALRYISPTQASILSVLEPLCVLLVGVFVLQEPISLLQMIGTVLMLSGALVSLYKN